MNMNGVMMIGKMRCAGAVLLLVMSTQSMSAATCLNLKEASLQNLLDKVSERCMQLSGKRVHPARLEKMKEVFPQVWTSDATVSCFASGCKDVSCQDRWISNFMDSMAEPIVPRLTAGWCNTAE